MLLAATGCGGGGSDPDVPTEITLSATDVTMAAVGQNVQLTATVLDQDGNPIPDAPVEWESGDPTVVTVSATGLLLALKPGTAEVTAAAGAASASASASVIVQSIAALQALEGNGQTAGPGVAVPTAPAVQVRDAMNDPVPGVRVRFQVGGGSGTVTGEIQTTDAQGIARVGSWRLGTSGINTLIATVDGAQLVGEPVEFLATTANLTGYDITIRYLGDYSNAQLLAFAEAELRWERIITGDLPDVNQSLPANSCGSNPETPGPFDDLTIFVTIEEIDGPFGTLGQAGPCFVRVPGDLTVIGRMQLDVADMELLESEGVFQSVILHEMGHVLGFGTLWTSAGLLADPADVDDPGANDPHFTGPLALSAFDAAGGTAYTGAKVPVMNVGGAGTINSHWRDEVFDPELMTGFLSTGFNPLSAITVRSLQDLGYTVNVAEADPFTIAPALRIAGPRRGRPMVDDIISDPIRRIDESGRVVGVIQR
ncbi:MAG: Ig-like domain-containing protein [Gemmatimonadales bacterium]|nr:Ig-like domain-containing protein [Gemmatimonadales bacterium]